MATVKVKRSTGSTPPTGLTFGELAFVQGTGNTADRLYIANSSSSSVWVGAQIENAPADWTSVTKLATQNAINTTFMPKSGGTFTGNITAPNIVNSFNGRTGAVQGVSAAVAGTGIAVSGATGSVTITNTGVLSFNGLTGAVGGVTTSAANTFTALQTFSSGISSTGSTFSGIVNFGQGSADSGQIRFLEDSDNGTNWIAIKAPAAVTSNITLTLPDSDGDAGQVLTTDGSGLLSWAAAGAAATATSIAGGATGSLPYQNGASSTVFLADPDVAGPILTYNNSTNAPEWKAGTGTGDPVRATSPTLTTPTLGVATATSVNKVAITAPATSATLTIADGKTLTASNTLTFTGTDASSVAFGTGGTVAYTSNNLGAFASTTSSQLAGVLSDETGTDKVVFNTSPTFVTSVATSSTTFGVFDATATTVNAFGAATTLNLGEDGSGTATTNLNVSNSGTKTVNVATGTGGNRTVNIGTGSSGATTRAVNILNTAAGVNTVSLPLGSAFNYDASGLPATGYVRLAYGLDTGTSPTESTYEVSIGTNATGDGLVNIGIGTSGNGTTTVNNNLVVSGNLTVNGTTTTINSTTLQVDDKLIELAHSPSGSTGNDAAVNGGGIQLNSTDGNKTLTWVDSTDSWTSSEHFNLLTGKEYKINGTSVLTATALGSAIISSSLTSVGALSSGSIASGFTPINVANVINITSLDIDGATETTTITGTDLLVVDDGANGTNRKVTVDNLFGSGSTATIDGGTF